MATEIERKFLVNPNWKDMLGANITQQNHIRQGYMLNTAEKIVRIRISDMDGFITIKGPRIDNVCPEFEYPIPLADAEQLIAMCNGTIDEIRHLVRDDHDQLWEVDVFSGLNEGLIMAEIELATADTTVYPTTWLDKEVSDDPSYTNAQLIYNKAPNL